MKRSLAFIAILSLIPCTVGAQSAFSINVSEGGYLGVTLRDVTAEDVEKLRLSKETGVVIESVVPDTPAATAGLEVDDVILSFQGATVRSVRQFQRLVADTPPGRQVELSISRAGSVQSRSAELAKRSSPAFSTLERSFPFSEPSWTTPHIEVMPYGDKSSYVYISRRPRLGIQAEVLTEQLAGFLGVQENAGLLVMEVVEDTPAAGAGLQAGDVLVECDGDSLESISDLSSHLKPGSHSLRIVRNKTYEEVSVEIPEPAAKKEKQKAKSTKL